MIQEKETKSYKHSIKREAKLTKRNNEQECPKKNRVASTDVIKSRNRIESQKLKDVEDGGGIELDENRAHPLNSNEKNKCTSFSMLIVRNDLFESISKRQRGLLSCLFLAVTNPR